MKENLYWTIFNKDSKQYPSLTDNEKCDVVIIGGGITGCLTAYYLSSYNIDTILIEKSSIGKNSSYRNLGFIENTTDLSLEKLSTLIEKEKALRANILCKKALDNLENILYLNNFSHLMDYKNFQCFYNDCKNSYHKTCAVINPLELCHTLLKKSQKKHCRIFENTPAISYDYYSDELKVKTSNSNYIKCKKIIFTDTLSSYKLIKEWDLLEFFNAHYIVTTPLSNNNKELLRKYLMITEKDNIYTYIRSTKDNRIMLSEFNGGSDKDKASYLLSKLQDILNYSQDLKLDYYFHKTYGESPDGLPYIGQHPKFNNCYFNLASGRNNICYSLIGAEIIKDLILYNYSSDSDIFTFERI